jgi:thiamine phosphate synthase YjbQ (UPF0047 family)
MATQPLELSLRLQPQERFDVIDVAHALQEEYGDLLERYRHALYCSYHTTAGYFDQQLAARLQHSREKLGDFVQVFQRVFPPNADYRHDQMELRDELTAEQKVVEPINADSHLTFISSGLRNCVTYDNAEQHPVFFVDLDGVSDRHQRQRKTTVLGFDAEVDVASARLTVPTDGHRIDSINLRETEGGFLEQIQEMVRSEGVRYGRVELVLPAEERSAGLTVNEYETLLMQHDVTDVLRDPLRFAKESGRRVLANPLAVPQKAHDYVHYDLVRVGNELLSALGFSESLLERAVARFVAAPAARFFRLKRSVSLLITDLDGEGQVAQGTYQSPILLQWDKANQSRRQIDVVVKRFE